jgi:hypothetical protein
MWRHFPQGELRREKFRSKSKNCVAVRVDARRYETAPQRSHTSPSASIRYCPANGNPNREILGGWLLNRTPKQAAAGDLACSLEVEPQTGADLLFELVEGFVLARFAVEIVRPEAERLVDSVPP